jgi:hypothetical protein
MRFPIQAIRAYTYHQQDFKALLNDKIRTIRSFSERSPP